MASGWAAHPLAIAYTILTFMMGYGAGHSKAMRFHADMDARLGITRKWSSINIVPRAHAQDDANA